MTPLRIATRASPLARWQAEHVAKLLAPRPVKYVLVRTEGDHFQDAALASIGGQGVFTKEVQGAVLRGKADIAVHSLKDLPTVPTEGLILAAVPPRGPVGDALVSSKYGSVEELPRGARVATGSVRRRAMVLFRRPDLQVVDIRGNVDTRLKKLETEELDGLILAEAGLQRLGLAERIRQVFDTSWCLPAVGQGALGIECNAEDKETIATLRSIDDVASWSAVTAERAFLNVLGGGCQMPVGALGVVSDDTLVLKGAVLAPDGSMRLDEKVEGFADEPESLGEELAERMIDRGARRLLDYDASKQS